MYITIDGAIEKLNTEKSVSIENELSCDHKSGVTKCTISIRL